MKLKDENGGGWKIKQLYADETALVAESREDLNILWRILRELGRIRGGMKNLNVSDDEPE